MWGWCPHVCTCVLWFPPTVHNKHIMLNFAKLPIGIKHARSLSTRLKLRPKFICGKRTYCNSCLCFYCETKICVLLFLQNNLVFIISGNPSIVLSQIKLDNPALFNIRIYSQERILPQVLNVEMLRKVHVASGFITHCCLCPAFHCNLGTCPVLIFESFTWVNGLTISKT